MADKERDLVPAEELPGISSYRSLDIALVLREAWENAYQPPETEIKAVFDEIVELGRKFGEEYGFPEGSSVLVKRAVKRGHRGDITPYRLVDIGVSKDAGESPTVVTSLDDPAANLVVVNFSTPSRLFSNAPTNTHRELSFTFRHHKHPDAETPVLGVSSSAQRIPWDQEFELQGESVDADRAGLVVPNTSSEHFGLLQKALGVLSDTSATRAVTPARHIATPVWAGRMQREALTRGNPPHIVRS